MKENEELKFLSLDVDKQKIFRISKEGFTIHIQTKEVDIKIEVNNRIKNGMDRYFKEYSNKLLEVNERKEALKNQDKINTMLYYWNLFSQAILNEIVNFYREEKTNNKQEVGK